MVIKRKKPTLLISASILVLILVSLACYAPFGNPPVVTVVVTQVYQPIGETPQNTSVSESSIPPTITISTTATPPPATATIVHLTRPGTYGGGGPYVWDSDSSVTASQHRPQGGEYFDRNLYERPFNAQTQDTYFPQVDITKSSILTGSPWIYAAVTLKAVSPDTGILDGAYGIEMDLNKDGRGDYLVLVTQPLDSDWSTDGVQVWRDSNKDVGDGTPIQSDPPQNGNGYDDLIFDQGKGNDPDLAWARVSPNKSNEVWFAFKPALINDSQEFLWSAWAQMNGLHPNWLDYNDHFTHDEAGSPLPDISQYPLKELAEVDNTCRWAVGFTPNGNEPGLCPLPDTPTPVPPTATSAPTFHLLVPMYPFHTKTPTPYTLY